MRNNPQEPTDRWQQKLDDGEIDDFEAAFMIGYEDTVNKDMEGRQ